MSVIPVPLRVLVDGCEPAFVGTTASFGTAGGITVSGRAMEPSFPADVATREFVPGWSERS
jgi:hypothetical protein